MDRGEHSGKSIVLKYAFNELLHVDDKPKDDNPSGKLEVKKKLPKIELIPFDNRFKSLLAYCGFRFLSIVMKRRKQ